MAQTYTQPALQRAHIGRFDPLTGRDYSPPLPEQVVVLDDGTVLVTHRGGATSRCRDVYALCALFALDVDDLRP
jgi:hypothetical protein